MNAQYFLYARKSTDVEDKQVLSIEAQLAEVRSYAKAEGLEVIEEIVEKQSAKIPGRPHFNRMIAELEKGTANGIVCWNPFMSTPSFISSTLRQFYLPLWCWNCTSVVLVFERLKHTVSQLPFEASQCPEFGLAFG